MLRARNCACTSLEVHYSRFEDPFVELFVFDANVRVLFAISLNRTKCTRTVTETTNTNITLCSCHLELLWGPGWGLTE